MLVPQKISKKKTLFLVLTVCIILGTITYLMVNSFFNIGIVPSPSPLTVNLLVVPTVQTEFNTDFLRKEPYTRLKKNGQWPVSVSQTGRSNPFQQLDWQVKQD